MKHKAKSLTSPNAHTSSDEVVVQISPGGWKALTHTARRKLEAESRETTISAREFRAMRIPRWLYLRLQKSLSQTQ